MLAPALRCLPAREQRILRMRFVEDRTQTEIARTIGVSQMQISRLLRQSLERLAQITRASTTA
jgi:RNA polymerase sigma-B factor